MPTPEKGESQDGFITRCVPIVMHEGTTDDNEQAVAICGSMWREHEKAQHGGSHASHVVTLRAAVQTAEVRTATYDGRPHLVVPVVAMLGDAVVRALGSKGDELVPASELAYAPEGWNGRPIVPDHPVSEDGIALSVNDPILSERLRFGSVFHTTYSDNRLKMEAWLDRERATRIGAEATSVVAACEKGEMVEVSIGCLMRAEQRHGKNSDGQDYDYVWHGIVPDHLAMGLSGSKGACSIDMGCGAPRAAKDAKEVKMAAKGITPYKRVSALSDLRAAEENMGMGSNELMYKINSHLRSVVPAFEGVLELYPETSQVIYAASQDPEDYSYHLYRCTYSIAEDGSVAFSGMEEVHQVMSYETVEAAAQEVAAIDNQDQPPVNSDCGCQQGAAQARAQKETTVTDAAKAIVGRLIACDRSPFAEADRVALEAFSEERLAALSEALTKAPDPPQPKTDEEWLAEAPESIRNLVSRAQTEEDARRSALIGAIRAASSDLSEDFLKPKSVEELALLAKAVKAALPTPDYSGRGLPVASIAAASAADFTPPDPYKLAQKGTN